MRDRKYRDSTQLSVLEGPRALDGALASGAQVEAIFARPDRLTRHLDGRAGHLYDGPIYEVPANQLDDLADAVNPQGVMGVVRFSEATTAYLAAQPRVVLLDGLRNPGNSGAIARSATAAGFSAMAATEGTADVFSPKSLRAAAGLTLGLDVCRNVRAKDVLAELGAAGHLRVRAAIDGDVTMAELAAELTTELTANSTTELTANSTTEPGQLRPITLVAGNEAVGISEETKEGTDLAVSIPMRSPVDSLNVAVAISVLMYAFAPDVAANPQPFSRTLLKMPEQSEDA